MAQTEEKSLLQLIDEQQLLKIQVFFDREEGKRLDEHKLKEVLWRVAKVEYQDEEFTILFNKINIARDGLVTWDEFISFLILTFQQKEIQIGYESLEPPIPSPPTMLKSMHRHPVNTIAFSPTVRTDRTISWNDGSVMTCSKDGCINYWSLDMQHERQVQSSCILLKVSTTWVLATVVMPDVSIVCTAGTERDLRFYDTSARKFELRVMISSIDYAVAAMHYVFSQNINEESKLLLGDLHGNIRVIYIQSAGRGPFKSTPGVPLLSVRFDKIIKNQVEGFRFVDFGRQHTDFVRQISWYPTLHSIVSCASCPKVAMLMKDITGAKENYTYKIPKGVWCFSVIEGVHLFATGGPDCLVRLWNPFVRNKPTAILYGHHTGIVHLVLQDGGKRLYSLSRDKCIKVWDVANQICLQTYLGLPPELGEYSDLSTLYNPESRQWIIGSQMIAIIPLSPKQDGEHTDGNTHVGGVSVVLYNPLYKLVVTCGLDSYIIVWNPWDGRRMCVVKDAHTKCMHGENLPIEITAAAFDPGYQRLLTAAHDGTLKVWNFNTGTCLRNMNVGTGQEITSVVWVKGRMMAVGWNRRVTEFADGTAAVGPGGIFCKNWDLRHKEDISSAVVRVPQTLATATYNGELILWRLETGQAYKQFNVSDPTTRIKIQYKVVKDRTKSTVLATVSKRARKSVMQAKKESIVTDEMKIKAAKRGTLMGRNILGAKKLSMVMVPEECVPLRKLAIHCMLFLEYREPEPNVGTLLVSLENGSIQVWSHHTNGNFITSFQAVHKAGDYVISMCSSKDNEFLFTDKHRSSSVDPNASDKHRSSTTHCDPNASDKHRTSSSHVDPIAPEKHRSSSTNADPNGQDKHRSLTSHVDPNGWDKHRSLSSHVDPNAQDKHRSSSHVDPNVSDRHRSSSVDSNRSNRSMDPNKVPSSKHDQVRRSREELKSLPKSDPDNMKKHLNSSAYYAKPTHTTSQKVNSETIKSSSVLKQSSSTSSHLITDHKPHHHNGNNSSSFDPVYPNSNFNIEADKIKSEPKMDEKIPTPQLVKRPSLFSPTDTPPKENSTSLKSISKNKKEDLQSPSTAPLTFATLGEGSMGSTHRNNEPELRPVMKKIDEVAGYENILTDSSIGVSKRTGLLSPIRYKPLPPLVKEEKRVPALTNGKETNPEVISNLLKQTPIIPRLSQPLEPQVVQETQNVEHEKKDREHHHKSKKKNKEKHKHKDKDKDKDKDKERKKKHKDKDHEKHKHKDKQNDTPKDANIPLAPKVVPKLPKSKIQNSVPASEPSATSPPSLKIRIPKDVIKTENTGELPQPVVQPTSVGGFKIKIPKDIINNCSGNSGDSSSSRKRERDRNSSEGPPAKVSKSGVKEKQNGRHSYNKVHLGDSDLLQNRLAESKYTKTSSS